MPGLTVSEKTHWKDRIAARIGQRMEAIRAEHPALFDRLKREAHAQAVRSLGIAAPYAELEAIQAEQAALERRKKRAQRTMLAVLKGVPEEEISDGYCVRYGSELALPVEVHEAIRKRQAAHEEKFQAEDEVGQEITRLEAERDGLLDTVWLAVSPAQMKQLWAKVAKLLGDEPTPLEHEALAPVKEAE